MKDLDESVNKGDVDLTEWTESELKVPEDLVKAFRDLIIKHTALKLKEQAIHGLYEDLSDTHGRLWAALDDELDLETSKCNYKVDRGKLYYRKKRYYER